METQKLGDDERNQVVRLVRDSIAASVRHEEAPTREAIEAVCQRWPLLDQPAGAFVTVYVKGQLRGCLGEILPEDPYAVVAARCGRRTPRDDYRFDPVQPEELPELTFKVSRLTPPEPVSDPDQIQVGEDGLIVRQGRRIGLLLPEVPVEHGWDRATFLKQLWRKAGLEPGTPIEQVELEKFGTEIMEGRVGREEDREI